jgi:nitrous oxide reductase accessory protein NosL
MKLFNIILMSILLVGCTTTQTQESSVQDTITLSEGPTKYCSLTAYEESDGKFLMVDKIFAEAITCTSNDDCYQYLLEQDDYRRLAPEFEPYLSCEKMEKVAPVSFA